jgi:hypothetical protein
MNDEVWPIIKVLFPKSDVWAADISGEGGLR